MFHRYAVDVVLAVTEPVDDVVHAYPSLNVRVVTLPKELRAQFAPVAR